MTTLQTSENADEMSLARPETFAANRAHAIWRRLRREEPVSWSPPAQGHDGRTYPGFWNITRYADILTISRDPATFISGQGITLGTTPEHAGPEAGLGKMLIVTDPPRHVRLRRLVSKGFTPRAVALFEPHVRQITTAILDDLAGRAAGDFVTEVAALLPLAVICDMMGVPRHDWPLMFDLTNKLVGGKDPEYQEDGAGGYETIARAHRQMFAYFTGAIAGRRYQRKDDLVSVLVDAEIDGDQLSEEEILYFCSMLILAGNETTRNAISGGLLALFEHPAQRERLYRAPELLSTAVEEILRWVSPVLHMARTATRDVAIQGRRIRAGERVVMWYPSANRDEAIFPDADTFDVGRTPNEHLGFGIGEHFCLGAGFARLELRVLFEELLQRFPDIELAGPPQRLRSTFIGGIKHLPVHYRRA
jgi:cytochrome P450